MGTAFTYQGFLESGSPPASVEGTCDFRFGLWDADVGGNEVGASPQAVSGVIVTDGVFTATMDFGSGAIDGTARSTKLSLGGAGTITLLPAYPITPSPPQWERAG